MPHTVVLFHSALGLRPAVLRFADRLRADGHSVYTPDLYDAEVFDSLEEGIRYRDSIGGLPALIERATKACAALPAEAVYAGFSLGAAAAQLLASTKAGARGAILMHGAIPPRMLGVDAWPDLPVQIHYAEGDPWVEAEEVEALRRAVQEAGQRCFVYRYAGSAHLFADEEGEDYDRAAAEAMIGRVRSFLGQIGAA